MKILYSSILIWNLTVMLVYGVDKLFARKHARRISEKTLITCAFILGGAGAMFGMVLFNHKTSKSKFRFLVPLATLLNITAVLLFHIYVLK